MNTTHAAPRGTGAQDAPCSPASPPGVSPAACPVPERVLRVVRGALDDLRHTHDAMHRARTLLDARFGGCGRYEADVIENRAETVARATADLATFRAAAARNGVEADAVLRGLGGVPDLTPSPAAAAYIAGSTAPAPAAAMAPDEGHAMRARCDTTMPHPAPADDATPPAMAPEHMGRTKTA